MMVSVGTVTVYVGNGEAELMYFGQDFESPDWLAAVELLEREGLPECAEVWCHDDGYETARFIPVSVLEG